MESTEHKVNHTSKKEAQFCLPPLVILICWLSWCHEIEAFMLNPHPTLATPRRRKVNGPFSSLCGRWSSIEARKHSWRCQAKSKAQEEGDDFVLDPKFVERNKRWVVLVDDEEDIRSAVGDFLYDQGYQVTACSDADALLEVCNQPRFEGEILQTPDAIISDIRMPGGKDGMELLGLIRRDPRLKRIPVILLTAKAMTQDRVAGYAAGADYYLPKPFDPDELLAMLDNSILRTRQMSGSQGSLAELSQEMANLKAYMKKQGAQVVKQTPVYLTLAEREVLELLSQGYTNAEIAQARGVGLHSVTRTLQKIYAVTGTKTRTELVRWALQTGYVSSSSRP